MATCHDGPNYCANCRVLGARERPQFFREETFNHGKENELTSSKNLQQEVGVQINEASRSSGYLKNPLWRNKYMSAEGKGGMCKTALRPIPTYAADTRADKTKAKNMMRAAKMKTLRTIKGTNHVGRMAEDRWAKWVKWAMDEKQNFRSTSQEKVRELNMLPKTLNNIKKSRKSKTKS
ncbi:hypothetical protein Trydic_g17886 [Trypoxylus dichotomus]